MKKLNKFQNLRDFHFFFGAFQGKLEVSSVTGRLEPREAPAWQRLAFRYLVSFPIIGLCLVAVFVVMFAMLQLQVSEQKQTHTHSHT